MAKLDEELLNILTDVSLGITTVEVGVTDIFNLFGVTKPVPLDERKDTFHSECKKLVLSDRSNVGTLTDFFDYWTEHTPKVDGRTKMRFEKQKTFDVNLRYKTWERNKRKFSLQNSLQRAFLK